MIHEALFALWNYPDDLFKTVTEEEWLNSVELQEFLHPGEKKLLGKILELALSYHKIERFRKMVNNQYTILYQVSVAKGEQDNQLVIQNNIRPGLYIKAFCDGLDNVLQSYKNAVVDIENTFLKNPSLTLAYILGEIQKFDTLLEVLSKMIRMIETENIHGVLLMSRLYLYTNCGIPLVVDAANRIVWIVRNDPKKTEDVSYQLKYRRDIWNGKDVEYYQKIQRLENYPFNLANFDKTIEECRLRITQYLWTIMVNEAKILKHLQHVRDYYALGRGELFQQFILTAGNHLKEAPNNYILKNLNLIFTETATKMYGENDKSYQKFELALIKTSEANTNPWTSLKLNFDIVWPLHIIFHPKALELYNKLFQFLLTITRTQIELNKLWQLHMSYKNKIDRRVWTLRHSLVYLVNNLQYYLQVDVIEAEFSVLKEAVKNANEFEDIIRLHSKFMSKLLSKTFVMCVDETTHHDHNHSLYQVPSLNFNTKNTIYNIILLLLEVCNEFCLIATTWNAELNELEVRELNELEKRADNLTEMLLRILYNIHQKVSGPDLLQLLYRLDFNRWYSKNKPDFNLSSV
ncbi:gamma tubulin complex protein [Holotrichia oblita]|uniref:Gamma tubulin complex protein n=1 Tax=Holotrichia oblita TaxID=644536 RepID=A0ACB9TM55_HOLOL|nr:gamma tubulin complex protein [Holotrichia oblita]